MRHMNGPLFPALVGTSQDSQASRAGAKPPGFNTSFPYLWICSATRADMVGGRQQVENTNVGVRV